MMGLNNDNGYDFFGVKKKSKKSSISFLGSYPNVKTSHFVPRTVNFIGKPISLAPRINKFSSVKQSYWKENRYSVPLWLQRNDDNRLGKTPMERKKAMQEAAKKKSGAAPQVMVVETKVKKGKKKTREEKAIRARQAAEKIIAVRMKARPGVLKSKKVAETELAYEESISRGKVPRAKILRLLAESRKKQIVTRAPERAKTETQMRLEKQLAKAREAPYKTGEEVYALKKGARLRYEAETAPRRELLKPSTYVKISRGERRLSKQRRKIAKELKAEKRKTAEEEAISRVQPFRAGFITTELAVEKAGKAVFTKKGRKALYGEIKEAVGTKEGRAKLAKGVRRKIVTGAEGVVEALRKHEVHPEAVIERGKAIISAAPQAFRATYGKEERAATQKVRRYVKAGVGGLFGASITQQKFGPAIRGRPSGPSGKYMIEGKPVFEEEYQKWAAQQRAVNRLTPSTQQQAPLTPEQQMVAPTTEQGYPTETTPMSAGEIEATKVIETPQRGGTPAELLAAQELAQQQDNVLNAPNILKGELKATGGSLLTPTGPQIMDAPNAFKGQLRTLGNTKETPAVRLGERPQTNPYGDEYIDIELGSGKPVLKRRPREKWMTGEAL